MNREPSGEYYDYTITMKPERPWLLPYHQSLVWKSMNANKDEVGNLKAVHLTFEQTLELIERYHNMTCGIPQVVYLTGWQYNGHDSKYPSWAEVNAARKTDGATPLYIASQEDHVVIVRLLLDAGADVNIKAHVEGEIYTPLSIAKKKGHVRTITFLTEYTPAPATLDSKSVGDFP